MENLAPEGEAVMNGPPQRVAQVLACLPGFLVIGLPYWSLPYQGLNLPNALLTPSLIVVPLAALLIRSFAVARTVLAIIIAGASVPATVMTRVMVECLQDGTRHNLWPFELVIALVLGFGAALPGALLGLLVASVARRAKSNRQAPI
jgi:hypothetical protein